MPRKIKPHKASRIDRKIKDKARARKPLTVSVATIAKNEGAYIGRLIESVQPFADQIVIGIDQTTTDNTREVCEEWAKKSNCPILIYNYKWEQHFSKARNQGVEKCTGDWIQCLDAHEYIHPDSARIFKDTLKKLAPHIKLIAEMLWNGLDEFGIPQTFFYVPKLFRNGFGIKWEGSAHNAIRCVPGNESAALREITVIHTRKTEDEKKRADQRKDMNVKVLEADAQAAPDDARPLFYIAQTHLEHGENEKAISRYTEYLKKSTFKEERYQALITMSELSIRGGNVQQGIEYARQAETECLDRTEHLILLADAHLRLFNESQDWAVKNDALRRAEVYAKRACSLCVRDMRQFNFKTPVNPHFMQGAMYTWQPWWILAQIMDMLGDRIESLDCVGKALVFRPTDPNILKAQAQLYQVIHKDNKPVIAVFDKTGQFTPPLIDALKDKYTFEVRKTWDALLSSRADAIFLEWADSNAVQCTNNPPPGKPIILRIHRYEVFHEDIHKIQWRNVHHLIFETEHIRRTFESKIKLPIRQGPHIHLIPNGVDLKRFTLIESVKDANAVAWCAFLTWKKGVDELLRIAAENRDKTFHVAGEWQSEDLKEYAEDFIESNKLTNLKFYGWVPDTNKWFDEIKPMWFLNTSLHEGMPYTVLEAAAKGIQPIVREWPGAYELFPASWLASSFPLYATETPSDLRQVLIDENYTLEAQARATMNVIEAALDPKRASCNII